MRRAALVFLVAGATVLIAPAFSEASADGTYSLDVPGSIETPERTVILDGTEFTVSSIARVRPGEPIRVAATAPADREYAVHLITQDKRSLVSASRTGTAAFSLETRGVPPGTYLLVQVVDGTPVAIHPVVLAGFSVAVDAPDRATPDTTIDVTIRVERLESGASLSRVEIAFASPNRTWRGFAHRRNETTFGARIRIRDSFEPGEYTLLAVAESANQTYSGFFLAVGVSDAHGIRVTSNGSTVRDAGTPGNPIVGAARPTSDRDIVVLTPNIGGTSDGQVRQVGRGTLIITTIAIALVIGLGAFRIVR